MARTFLFAILHVLNEIIGRQRVSLPFPSWPVWFQWLGSLTIAYVRPSSDYTSIFFLAKGAESGARSYILLRLGSCYKAQRESIKKQGKKKNRALSIGTSTGVNIKKAILTYLWANASFSTGARLHHSPFTCLALLKAYSYSFLDWKAFTRVAENQSILSLFLASMPLLPSDWPESSLPGTVPRKSDKRYGI